MYDVDCLIDHCSESSGRGYVQQQQQPERKVSLAFVDAKPPKPDDFFMPDIPFSNLLASTMELQDKKGDKVEGAATNPGQENTQVWKEGEELVVCVLLSVIKE